MSALPSLIMSDGHKIPVIGLGTFTGAVPKTTDYETTQKAIEEAILAGYRHFDCAWIYGNEDDLGQAFRRVIDDGIINRDDLFITTKLWNCFHNPTEVEQSCMESMKNLGIDYIDLYLIHWPHTTDFAQIKGKEETVHVDYLDTWKAMEKLVDKGLVRSIGVSNFNSKQIERILSSENLKHRPVCNQIEIHPYLTNEKLIEFCKSKDIVVTGFSPLGAGYKAISPVLLENPVILKTAKSKNKTPAQVLLRWIVQKGCAVIPKSINPKRIKENIEIFDFSLNDDEMEDLNKLNKNFRYTTADEAISDVNYPFHEEF